MKRKVSREASLRAICGQVFEDDVVERRTGSSRDSESPHRDRKALQLCKQARRAIESCLAMSPSPIVSALRVLDVSPVPDGTRLRVLVGNDVVVRQAGAARVEGALASVRASARAAVAAAITRKRAPVVELLLVPESEASGMDAGNELGEEGVEHD